MCRLLKYVKMLVCCDVIFSHWASSEFGSFEPFILLEKKKVPKGVKIIKCKKDISTTKLKAVKIQKDWKQLIELLMLSFLFFLFSFFFLAFSFVLPRPFMVKWFGSVMLVGMTIYFQRLFAFFFLGILIVEQDKLIFIFQNNDINLFMRWIK